MEEDLSVPQNSQPPQVLHTQPRKSPWLLILAIAMLMLGVGLAGGYFLFGKSNQQNSQITSQVSPTVAVQVSPSPVDETANWQTYTSKTNGFIFQYPTSYKIITDTPQSASFGFSIGNETPFEYLKVTVGKPTDIAAERAKSSQITVNEKTISLGGKSAKQYSLYGPGDYAYEIVQTTSTPVVELNMYVAGGGLSRTFDQIKSTFKFTSNTSATDTSSWKTFTDPKNRFTLQYPSAWTTEPHGFYTPAADLDKHSLVRLIKPGNLETSQDITIGVYDGLDTLSALDFLTQYWCKGAVMEQYYKSCIKDLIIHNNYNGTNFSVVELLSIIPGALGPGAWIVHNNYGIFLSANNMRYTNQKDMQIFNQILSSFIFKD